MPGRGVVGHYFERYISDKCCQFFHSLSKKLVFMPVASVLTGAHGDGLVLPSNTQ